MDNLILFNKAFPNSHYREIHSYVSEEDHDLYQKSKAPINGKVLSFDEIKMTDNRVGWIVPKEYIVVDIDNLKYAGLVFDILQKLKCKFSYTTSKHGGHFIFKNKRGIQTISSGLFCSLGFQIDIRCNEKGYIILPYNDKDRHWGTISNELDDIPFFLIPLKQFKPKENMTELEDGDGRNSKLYAYYMALRDYSKELTLDEQIDSVKIINSFLFKNPLEESELYSTVLRPENCEEKEEKTRKKDFCLEEEIATKVIADKQIITCNDICYRYNGKYYEFLYEKEIERMIHEEYSAVLKERNRKEIINFIKLKTYVNPSQVNSSWNKIVFRNGILNISEMKLYPHTASEYNTIYIDQNFIENAPHSDIIEQFFETISRGEEDKKTLLYEVIGYCFIRKNIFEKFFICVGEGSTGKSTYLNLIRRLIGEKNTTYLGLKDLENIFMPVNLFGKLINIGDDISFKGVLDSDVLKKIVSGQEIMAQQKFKEPISFSNFAKLIFTSNKMPNFLDRTTGLYRRLCIIDINRKIEKPDPFFLDKITEQDYEYLLWCAISAIRKAINRNSLTNPASISRNLRKFQISQSSVLMYLDENGYNRDNLNKRPYGECYAEYRQYCLDCGYKPVSKLTFRNDVCDELHLVVANTTNQGEKQCWRFSK